MGKAMRADESLGPTDDKVAQLHELANIVLGIRLFNRHIGKGGAGIVDLYMQASELATALIPRTSQELQAAEARLRRAEEALKHKDEKHEIHSRRREEKE